MTDKYIIEDGNVVPCNDLLAWGRWMESGDRRVARTQVGESDVSTVFLGLDHSFGGGTPILFETMVFGGPLDQEQERYATREEAVAGHEALVERIRQLSVENTERSRGRKEEEAMTGDPVYVKLTRPEGYEDACEQIVIEDAEIHPGFMPKPATEEVERLRSEVRAMTEISINLLHASGILATGLDLVQIRALTEALDGEGESAPMKLRDNETLLEGLDGRVRISRSYLPATHTYDFTFERTDLYCPHCGAKDVWREESGGDYYVGPEHRCGQCGADFCLP